MEVLDFLAVTLMIYAFLSIVPFFIGLSEGSRGNFYSNCNTRWERIELAFPAYRFGCFMGSPYEKSED